MAYAADHTMAPTRRTAQLAQRRGRAFVSAKRHSFRVRLLKLLLPLSAAGILSLYVVPAVFAYAASKAKIKIDSVVPSISSLKMMHPHYTGVHPTYGAYEISAESGTQQIKHTDIVTLDQISAIVVSPSKETTTLTAPDGVLHTKEELLTLDNGAIIVGTNGLWAKLKTAEVAFKTRVVTTHEPVELRFHESTITADSAVIYASESRVEFTGSVHVHMVREPAAPDSAASHQPKPTATLADRGRPAPPAPQTNWTAETSQEPEADNGAQLNHDKRAKP